MCKKTQFKYCPSTIDKCMRNIIKILNTSMVKTLSCCCGHGKYPMTIVVEFKEETKPKLNPFEFFSGKVFSRKKRFYKKDKQGYYFIPEVMEKLK